MNIFVKETIVVEPEDTLWKVANNELNNGKRWKYLFRFNKHLQSPFAIKVGDELKIPTKLSIFLLSFKFWK